LLPESYNGKKITALIVVTAFKNITKVILVVLVFSMYFTNAKLEFEYSDLSMMTAAVLIGEDRPDS
jgi:hypothetical protein